MLEVDPWSPAVTAVSFGLLGLGSLLAGLLPAVRSGRPDLARVLEPE